MAEKKSAAATATADEKLAAVLSQIRKEFGSSAIMKMIEKGKFNYTSSGTDALRKAVRDSLSNFIWNRTRTRPMIIPVVMEV